MQLPAFTSEQIARFDEQTSSKESLFKDLPMMTLAQIEQIDDAAGLKGVQRLSNTLVHVQNGREKVGFLDTSGELMGVLVTPDDWKILYELKQRKLDALAFDTML